MRRRGHRVVAATAILLVALSSSVQAEASRHSKKREQAATPATPADKRDRVVTAPGTPFHGKAYWQAAAQCGGIFFKLGTVYSDAAIRAKVIKPDPAAYTRFTKQADDANKTATAYFDAAERFLMADRKLARDDAVITYDPTATDSGERVKTAEAALAAAKPCPDLYKACRGAFPQVCNDSAALTN